jgi:anti-repressor protein
MQSNLSVIEKRQVFGNEFTIYGDYENPLFLVKDVASWIERDIASTNRLAGLVDEDEKLISTIYRAGQNRECLFVTENGLYEILFQSRKPIAKAFKKEVKKILHDIRRHGMYADPIKLEDFLKNPEEMIKALQALKEEREARKALKETIETNKRKLIFVNAAETIMYPEN